MTPSRGGEDSDRSGAEPLRDVFRRAHEAFVAEDRATRTFDPSASPLHGRVAFIVAAPRSGTTWLQQMLSAHPEIATSMESHLVPDVVRPLLENHSGTPVRLGAWISRTRLIAAARRLADDVFESMRTVVKPDAGWVLEKSPSTHVYASALAEVFPDARYLHVIRDGRQAALSAHRLWPGTEEYGSLAEAARRWKAAVEDIREHVGGLRYVELRYEELRSAPRAGLEDVLGFLGLDVDDVTLDAALRLGATPVNVRPVRRGGNPSAAEEAKVLAEAGDLLQVLGYVDPPAQNAPMRRRRWRWRRFGGRR